MATLLARQGRHRQRYENNRRLVSGCIPYRLKKGCEDHDCYIEDSLEVLMVSSPTRHDLVFPKGGWDNDESVHEAACREALEEAGVRGTLNERELGVWEFRSKSRQYSLEGGCRGYMFAMEVTEELDIWPEQENHGRKWLSIIEAFRLCRYEWMREALREFLKLMEREKKMKMNNPQMIMDSSAIVQDRHAPTATAKPTSTHCSVNSSAAILAIEPPSVYFFN